MKTIFIVVMLIAGSAAAHAETNSSNQTCTKEKRVVQGQQATCDVCKKTICDTSGGTLSNCRVETTTTCEITDIRPRVKSGTVNGNLNTMSN